ncbi:PspC domain-containing protein [Amycolatopsis arida]|nr:PspC domain-containing protein [Amycolatopsis arida]
MSGATDTSSPPNQGFEATIKDFWVSRPRRPQHGRKIAGVAAGIGNRYGIDPVVVRVALVVATIFGGVGVFLYLLGWLLFPDERDEVSPVEALVGRGRSTTSAPLTVLLCVALIPSSGWVFGGGWFDGGGFIALALFATAGYLLHRSRGHLNRPVAPPAGTFAATHDTPTSATTTPGWDPLGAAPLAWDLPDPVPAPSPAPPSRPSRPARPPRRRSVFGPLAFWTALVVAVVGVNLGLNGVAWFTPEHVIGLALAVLGAGMVAGAFRGGGRGLVLLAVPLAVVGLALAALPFREFTGGMSNLDAAPRTAQEVLPSYSRTVGNVDLDLSALPATAEVSTVVSVGAGNGTVIVPDTADVRFTCESWAGEQDCLDERQSGMGLPPVSGENNGGDGPGGARIDLTVRAGTGNVEVRRG